MYNPMFFVAMMVLVGIFWGGFWFALRPRKIVVMYILGTCIAFGGGMYEWKNSLSPEIFSHDFPIFTALFIVGWIVILIQRHVVMKGLDNLWFYLLIAVGLVGGGCIGRFLLEPYLLSPAEISSAPSFPILWTGVGAICGMAELWIVNSCLTKLYPKDMAKIMPKGWTKKFT